MNVERVYTHFVWLRTMRGTLMPQLWTEDLTLTKSGNNTPLRADCMRFVAELVAFKVEIPKGVAPAGLDEAMLMWPFPVDSRRAQ